MSYKNTIEEAKSALPKSVIEQLARCLLPLIREFLSTEEGRKEYEEWKAKQDASTDD